MQNELNIVQNVLIMNFAGVSIMKETKYILSSGELKRKDNTLFFLNSEGKRNFFPVENTSQVMIFGEVNLNKRVMEFFSQKEIVLHLFSYYGYYMGSYYPREHYNSGYMILNQSKYFMGEKKRLILAKCFVKGAALNMMKVLEYYRRNIPEMKEFILNIRAYQDKILGAKSVPKLMSVEANIRELYFGAFDFITGGSDFTFEKRSRRPPKNNINALISFGNSILYVTVLSEIYKTHLDPRIGYLHETNFRRFTLNLDIAEIFKPVIVDRVIFSLINRKEISGKHFVKELGGILLNESGRRKFIERFEEKLRQTIKHTGLNRKVSYRRLIRMECYKLEKHLMGDKKYKPFRMRW